MESENPAKGAGRQAAEKLARLARHWAGKILAPKTLKGALAGIGESGAKGFGLLRAGLRSDPDVFLAALRADPEKAGELAQAAGSAVRDHEGCMEALCVLRPDLLGYASPRLLDSPEWVRSWFSALPRDGNLAQACAQALKCAGPTALDCRDIAVELLERQPSMAARVGPSLRSDRDLMLWCIEKSEGWAWNYLPDPWRADKGMLLAGLAQKRHFILWKDVEAQAPHLLEDEDCLAALLADRADNYGSLPQGLRLNRRLALAACSASAAAMDCAGPWARDAEFCMEAAGRNLVCARGMGSNLAQDGEFCLRLAQKHPRAYEYFPEKAKMHLEAALAALAGGCEARHVCAALKEQAKEAAQALGMEPRGAHEALMALAVFRERSSLSQGCEGAEASRARPRI